MTEAKLHILGIRHHGPGSARSMLGALEEIRPDCLLIEGPPDADELISFAARNEMKPPVALLVHDANEPSAAVYYPMAEFSPEWQAMRWAAQRRVPVRFMDLPQWHRLAVQAQRMQKFAVELEAKLKEQSGDGPDGPQDGKSTDDAPTDAPATAADLLPPPPPVEPDPLQQLAKAAGFDDGERWWEHVIESRRDGDLGIFAAIRDAMAELRAAPRSHVDPDEELREAWMRRTIREAMKQGFATIAVVCGAWHAPALDMDATPKKQDDDLLKPLPRRKTAVTWVPWTYDRLTFASGYGAGVRSPGWYEHLWRTDALVLESWMTRVAHLLRKKDIDCSSAHVIEASRLSQTLATLRARPLADLSDIADATRATFCFDSDLAMRLIERELLVGHRMGEVPEDTPMVPLQQDLMRWQKRLRLKPEALEKTIDLDLRNENDRERSVLLHRLRLLNIEWGTPAPHQGSGKGTFHEYWQLRWDPGFTIRLIEAGALGNTIEQAAGAALSKLATQSSLDLRGLAAHLQDAMLADLDAAARTLVRQIENVAAVAADVTLLMETLPPLVSLVRYGNVRQTDADVVRHIIDGIVPRIVAGLGGAVSSLNDDAAAAMEQHLRETHASLERLGDEGHTKDWLDALLRILDQDSVHGLVRGRCARLLLDAGRIDTAEVGRRLSLTLSRGTDPGQGARWLEGFLSGSGLLLIHDSRLLDLINDWIAHIPPEIFQELLPLLRRTFTTFPAGERRQIGQLVAKGRKTGAAGDGATTTSINPARAERVLPLLVQILGGKR